MSSIVPRRTSRRVGPVRQFENRQRAPQARPLADHHEWSTKYKLPPIAVPPVGGRVCMLRDLRNPGATRDICHRAWCTREYRVSSPRITDDVRNVTCADCLHEIAGLGRAASVAFDQLVGMLRQPPPDWRAGVEACIREVQSRRRASPGMKTAGYSAALAELLIAFETMSETGSSPVIPEAPSSHPETDVRTRQGVPHPASADPRSDRAR